MDNKKQEFNEFKEFREQISLLRSKLRTQEIVGDNDIMAATKKSMGWIQLSGMLYVALGVFAIPFCCIALQQRGFSLPFVWATGIYLALCVLVTVYMHRSVCGSKSYVETGNLVEVSSKYLKLRKNYVRTILVSIPAIIVWALWLYFDAKNSFSDPAMIERVRYAIFVGGPIGVVIGLWRYFKTIKETDSILAHIRELQESDEK